jgi:hypothetical protein
VGGGRCGGVWGGGVGGVGVWWCGVWGGGVGVWWGVYGGRGVGGSPLALEHSKVCTLCDFGHLQFYFINVAEM